ncbi:cytochrome c biogenesis CcdA family protein [Vibrio cholerae]|uniref:cytochrome c biogenesis CcdA family protein n=1 Tax=Vibrio cholerae TaxID=666 RepID=UPI0015CF00BA|nr:cytochrome c biogenesis CcdA family protein [Vibrio cholerae]EGR0793187.1 cytochrome c biogenesis protein CcdA [Vibrio cholerae]EGR0805250.1 cytochrome c biogenesis protein CcdA [Vibrio cholerae]EGR0811454.1 cytochrome c biogenesis protein CcdA [Vibrio cholerae]EGR0875386.1 cytochrome c biogenesis protein CcdA [Vibrio cholerae]EJE4211623.1 cytochrome c biogenesis protein CcdA [Vibrio cholerae]
MDISSIPLAFLAGILSLLSPCVLPMIPAVASSAMQASRIGLVWLAIGISVTFAIAGSLITFILLSLGISPDILRYFSAGLMLLMGMVLLIPALNDRMSYGLSLLVSRMPDANVQGSGAAFQLVVGMSLGLVWLPCVGPTLGTAIALASTGQNMLLAFFVMLAFGLGCALPLVGIGYASGLQLKKIGNGAKYGKYLLAIALLLLSTMIFTGFDKQLEIWALDWLPDWMTSI